MAKTKDAILGLTAESQPNRTRGVADAVQAPAGQRELLEQHEPPFTVTRFLTSPKFGAAGSGGLEYERLPEAHLRVPR